MLKPETNLILILESERDLEPASNHLFRIGLDRVVGYLHDGMESWNRTARPLEKVEQWTVRELEARRMERSLTILDVRSPEEVSGGRVPGAQSVYLPHLEDNLSEIPPDKPVAVYCGSGYRASIATSVLQRHDYETVINVPGSWTAWQAAELAVESEKAHA